jgi:undecaprenyl-diphosphatase
LSYFEIVLLALIQGLTEFFPVSSSGHLVLFQNLMGISEPQIFIDIMLHVGTLLALFVFLHKELGLIIRALPGFIRRPQAIKTDPHIQLAAMLALACIPTFLMGYFFSDFFESLFSSLRAVGTALLLTGLFLFTTRFHREKKKRKILHSLIIGFLQGAAIVPGFSRSGLTIGGALLLGWKREQAARFSFLLSIPAIAGASLFQLGRIDTASQPWMLIITGIIVSAFSGYLALRFLVSLINRGQFYRFAFYCLAAGLFTWVVSFYL